jgi:hypothetical protein
VPRNLGGRLPCFISTEAVFDTSLAAAKGAQARCAAAALGTFHQHPHHGREAETRGSDGIASERTRAIGTADRWNAATGAHRCCTRPG